MHAGIHGSEIAPPIEDGAAFDAGVAGFDDQRAALPVGPQHGARRAAQLHGLVDDELPVVLARRQQPAVLALRLQRQVSDGLHLRHGRAFQLVLQCHRHLIAQRITLDPTDRLLTEICEINRFQLQHKFTGFKLLHIE